MGWVPFFLFFKMAFLCVFQQGEFKNTIKAFWGEVHVNKKKAKKVEGFFFSCRFFPSFFYRVFGRFSA
jgi:hypothetical protein